MYLIFTPSDHEFRDNLLAIREYRLDNRKFTKDFTVCLESGKLVEAKTAYVKGDGKTFEYDGIRVDLDKIINVTYKLG